MFAKVQSSLRNMVLPRRDSGNSAYSDRPLNRISTTAFVEKPKSILRKSTLGSESTHSSKKQLSFASISIREYPVLIGDNPSVSEGVPLTIGWEHETETDYGLDDYESEHRAEPKPLSDMKFSPEERTEIAKNLGYSETKIEKIAHQVKYSTLTRKKKMVKTLHLRGLRKSVNRAITRISDATMKMRGIEEQEDDESSDDRDEMAY